MNTKTITEQVTYATFDKLNEDVKQIVRNSNEESLTYDWWTTVKEEFKNICELMGISVKDTYFSGFYSQGDGACFAGDFSYNKGCVKAVKAHTPQDKRLHQIVQLWYELQKTCFYRLYGSIKQSGHYYHEFCTEVYIYIEHDNKSMCSEDDTAYGTPQPRQSYTIDSANYTSLNLLQKTDAIMRALCKWYYNKLENQWDYLCSDDAISSKEHMYNIETGEIE